MTKYWQEKVVVLVVYFVLQCSCIPINNCRRSKSLNLHTSHADLHRLQLFDNRNQNMDYNEFKKNSIHRNIIKPSIVALATLFTFLKPSRASSQIVDTQPSDAISSNLAQSFLYERVTSLATDKYRPGIRQSDVFYPLWFLGSWTTESHFDNYFLPLGEEIAGGHEYVERSIQSSLNTSLVYNSTFYVSSDGKVVSDRLSNVRSIALASLGEGSTVGINPAQRLSETAMRMEFTMKPISNQNTTYDIALITTDRDQKWISPTQFEVMERTEQVISPRTKTSSSSDIPSNRVSAQSISRALVKEIETITCYERVSDEHIIAKQRTATYFSPVDARYQRVIRQQPLLDSTAVEVRYYTLHFLRQQK